jgi:sporulation integral membrane protein YtvI
VNNRLETRKNFIINVLYFVLAAALLYFAVKYVLGWVLPFIIGFLVALLLKPAICFLSKKSHVPYKATAVILALLFYASVGLLLTLLGIKLIYILIDGFAALPGIYKLYIEPLIDSSFIQIQDLIAKLDPKMVQIIQNMTSSFSDSAGTVITGVSSQVIKVLTSTVTSLPSLLLAVLLSIISSIFFAMDYTKITVNIMKILPGKMQSYVLQLKKLAGDIGIKYVKSYAILMSVTFIELSIGFLILGVDNAVAVAALIALIDLLPILGTGGIVIPWVLIELIKGNITFGAELAVLYCIITIVRNIIEPKIVGKQIGVHPLAMLISMYVGLQIFGFIGIFILPIILVVVKGFYDNKNTDHL